MTNNQNRNPFLLDNITDYERRARAYRSEMLRQFGGRIAQRLRGK